MQEAGKRPNPDGLAKGKARQVQWVCTSGPEPRGVRVRTNQTDE